MKTDEFLENLKYDLPASIVVFLVAVPFCLGIALASGAPLFSGIIAGFVGGIVVSMLSGSALGVSGPAAGLVVIVLSGIERFGFEVFQMALALAGLMQIGLGCLRAGFVAYYFPTAVIKGMLSAIGILIVIRQIPYAMGYDLQGRIGFFLDKEYATLDIIKNIIEIEIDQGFLMPGAFLVWVFSMAVLLLWERPFFKDKHVFRWIQGPLVVVVLGALIGKLFEAYLPSLALSKNHYVRVPVGGLSQFFQQFTFPNPIHLMDLNIYGLAVTMALVGSLETLLCVEATSKLDPLKRFTPANRELKAQGVGNMVSGLIGGLPITQVIVRSSANVQSGGRTKTSAILHGVLILLSAMMLPDLLNMIPFSSLAAILMMVGYKLAKPIIFKEILSRGHCQFIPFITTIIAIVASNLLAGVVLGFFASAMFILWENYKFAHYYTEDMRGERIVIRLSEHVSFLNKSNIHKALNGIPDNYHVIIDGSNCNYMDYDVFEIVEDFAVEAQTKNIKLELIEVTQDKTL